MRPARKTNNVAEIFYKHLRQTNLVYNLIFTKMYLINNRHTGVYAQESLIAICSLCVRV
jgi:hypothetical protein